VGEAAHALPPIGAQGLNMGLADVEVLVGLARATLPDHSRLVAAYERRRGPDVRMRSMAVDGLNRSLLSGLLPVQAARGLGLGLLARIGPLRRAAMRAGSGSALRQRLSAAD
jgi:2-octaprenyl-6-methoxyphenol hydroxylase